MSLDCTVELVKVTRQTIRLKAANRKEAIEKALEVTKVLPGTEGEWEVASVTVPIVANTAIDTLKQIPVKNTKNEGECRGRDRADGVFDSTCLHCTSLSDNVNPSTPCLCQGEVE